MRLFLSISLVLVVLIAPCFAQETAPGGPFTDVEVVVCSAIEDRQPVGAAESFGSDVGQLFCWTKCLGATDTTAIQHVWTREGETIATVDLPVKSPAWRTWSSKQLLPSWTGSWEVRVLDAGGNIIRSVTFKIEPQAAMPVAEPDVEPTDKPSDTLGPEVKDSL